MGKKVALVLSGGGARGIAHIGVIEELERRGYQITSIAGTSMGALVGGMYALGKLADFKELLLSYNLRNLLHLVDFTLSRQGLMKGDKVLETLKDEIKDAKIEQLSIPYVANATDLINKEEIVFREGSVYDAIRASISIPTVFTPVRTETALMVDGGVMNNLPLEHIERQEGDVLVAVDVNAMISVEEMPPAVHLEEEKSSEEKSRIETLKKQIRGLAVHSKSEAINYHYLIDSTISTMMHQITYLNLMRFEPDMLINISRDVCGALEFYKGSDLISIGEAAAKEVLDHWEAKSRGIE